MQSICPIIVSHNDYMRKNPHNMLEAERRKISSFFPPLFIEDEYMNEVLEELPLHFHHLHLLFMKAHPPESF